MAKKWHVSLHRSVSNSEDPFPLAYQKSAQSDNKNLYQKYPTRPETTEKQQKTAKTLSKRSNLAKTRAKSIHKGLSFPQKAIFL